MAHVLNDLTVLPAHPAFIH